MAELLLTDEWAEPSPLGWYLRDTLPDEYTIVPDATVHGCPLDAVVVGPPGLVIVHARDWEGEVHPAQRGPWRVHLAPDQDVRHPSPAEEVSSPSLAEEVSSPSPAEEARHPNPAEEARQATKALRAFLRDEFPALRPAIHHLVVLTNPEATLAAAEGIEPMAVGIDAVSEAVTALEAPSNGALSDGKVRKDLALALRERKLTTSQRASEPFVFRAGGLFGSGKKVWTIRAAVQHMDRHPEDGTLHLHNGTLVNWLSDQGAGHLVDLAQAVLHEREADQRIQLENFLIGTGLVERPRLTLHPKRIDLGCSSSGETCSSRFEVSKGRGRGYLFGAVHTSEPWLRVDPRSIKEGKLEAVVTADTETLPISRTPWQAEILIESSASEEPVSVPVRLRVMGTPSNLNRYLIRPLAGALSAGLVGAVLGWALGRWGIGAPAWFDELAGSPAAWPLACAALTGLFWAILGGIRGWLQPAAWPIAFAARRWFLRTLAWGAGLSLLAVVIHWVWQRTGPDVEAGMPAATTGSVILLALALSILPAVLGEIRSAREEQETEVRPARRSLLRPLLVAAAGLVLVLVLVAGTLFLIVAWQQFDLGSKVSTAGQSAGDGWTQLEEGANDLFDQLIIQYYQSQAPPTATPAPTRVPTLMPGTQGGTP